MSRSEVTLREVLLADMYEEQIDRLTAEVERLKKENQTHWDAWLTEIMALRTERDDLQSELSRYKQGVETTVKVVEQTYYDLYAEKELGCGIGEIRITRPISEVGQRFKVLVMKGDTK